SMHTLTLGSRKMFRTFAVQAAVLMWTERPVHRYQFGVTCGPPRGRFVARTALGIVSRNSACRSGLGFGTIRSLRSQAGLRVARPVRRTANACVRARQR